MPDQQGQIDASQQSPAQGPRRRAGLLACAMGLCAAIAVGCLAFEAFFGGSIDLVGPGGRLASITVVSPALTRVIGYALPGSLLAMLVIGIVAFVRRIWAIGVMSLAGLFLLFCAWVVVTVLTAFDAPWLVVDQRRGPDDKQYAYLYYGVLQAQRLVLATESSQDGWHTTYDVLGETNGDSPRSWTAVVRPADCDGGEGRLLAGPDGWLVGLRYDNHCYFAYQVGTGRYLAHEDVKDISPLILIGPDTKPLDKDVKGILTAGEMVPGKAGLTVAELRAEAARHPNAKIRKMFKDASAIKSPETNSASKPSMGSEK